MVTVVTTAVTLATLVLAVVLVTVVPLCLKEHQCRTSLVLRMVRLQGSARVLRKLTLPPAMLLTIDLTHR